MMIFLRGGEEVTGATLSRFFGFHVAVLPGVATLAHPSAPVAGPASRHQRFPETGTAVDRESVCKAEMKFFPNFMLREMMAWYVALGVLGALAAVFPWNLGVKADPFVPAPAGIKPEWYFLFNVPDAQAHPFQGVVHRRRRSGCACVGLVGLLWLLLPFFRE